MDIKSTLEKLFEYLCLRYEDSYIGIQGWTDKVEGSESQFVVAKFENFNEFKKKVEYVNIKKKLAVGFCINPLKEPKRKNETVKQIQHILIDLDGENIFKDYEAIKSFLTANNIKSKYEDKSGNGYHFLIPVKLELDKANLVEKFLEYMKSETKINSIDTKVKLLTQILRIPESIHRKTGTDIKLETLEWNHITHSEIDDNNKSIMEIISKAHFKSLLDSENQVIQQNEMKKNQGDYFFSKLLSSAKLRKQLAKTENIGKNDSLFKNLAIFVYKNPKHAKNANNFIAECGHSKSEFAGWLKKAGGGKITKINYIELFNWVETNKLDFLKKIIDEQIHIEGNFINNFEICFMKNTRHSQRYLNYDKLKCSIMVSTETDMYKAILIEANMTGFNFIDYYNIYIYDKDGGEITEIQKENKIINNLRKTIKKYKLMRPVFDFGYKPSNERYFIFDNETYLNTYKPGPLEDYWEEKKIFNFPYIKALIMNLVDSDEIAYNYICKWLSFILQNPLMKLPTSIIFMGTQGIGKGRFRDWILPGIWGEKNVKQINEKNLEKEWGDFLISKRFIVANEIKVQGKSKEQIRKKIKEYSTDQRVSIQLKGRDDMDIMNYSHWLFFSDQDVPFEIESNDRRHSVFNCDNPLPNEIAETLSPELNPGYLEKELKDFVLYLKNINVEFDEVRKVFNNEAKQKLIEISKDSVVQFFEELRNFGSIKNFAKGFEHHFAIESANKKFTEYILVRDLYSLYDHWCKKNMNFYPKSNISFAMTISKTLKINSTRMSNIENNQRFYNIEEIFKEGEE